MPLRARSSRSFSRSRSPARCSERWTTGPRSWRKAARWCPNDFVVEVAEDDYARLEVYADSLGIELATLAREYAKEQGYSFVGPVRMRFEGVRDLTTGRSGSCPA